MLNVAACPPELRPLVEMASSSPMTYAGENCDTTTRHKTHSTELEVYYPWHPWFGLKVTTNRPFTRRGVARVYATLEHEGRLQQLEMPGWMFDRATCPAFDSQCRAVVTMRDKATIDT
jgi:hypothetical protein